MANNNKDRADFMCAAFKRSLRALKIVEDVYEGPLRIRDCRKEYLLQNPAEEDTDYNRRLNTSVFPPFFKRAIGRLVGIVFCNDPNLKEVEPEFEDFWKNIDLTGTKGEIFFRNALLQGAKDGHSLIYVDMPPPLTESATMAGEPTALDEHLAEVRPFCVLYKKGQAVNWKTETINGKTVLTMIVFRECTMERDGEFGEREVVRYRVLRPGSWQLYRQSGRSLSIESDGPSSLDYIPVYPVYGDEVAPFESQPAMLDTALLTIQLYQKQSDLDSILHIANVPVMWARDRNTNVPFTAVGPTVLIDLSGEHSEIGFAEHQGNAIEAAQKDIERLKVDISMSALEMLADKQTPGPKTATGEIIDTAESNSELSLMVKSLEAAAQGVLETYHRYVGREPKGSIEFQVEWDRLVLSVEEMRVLKEYADDSMLSPETVLELLKRAGKLGKDFDVKKELERIFGKELAAKPQVERTAATDMTRQPGEQPLDEEPAAAPSTSGKPTTKKKVKKSDKPDPAK